MGLIIEKSDAKRRMRILSTFKKFGVYSTFMWIFRNKIQVYILQMNAPQRQQEVAVGHDHIRMVCTQGRTNWPDGPMVTNVD